MNPPTPRNAIFKYNRFWKGHTHLSIELACYKAGLRKEQGGLGAAGHFKEAAKILWGEHNERKKFVWSPWADKMLEASVKHKYLAVSGCANAGKSDFYAVYAIINWLCDPLNTMILVTSTSLKESKGRIWGSIEEYWMACPGLPGKLVTSLGLIRMDDPTGQFKAPDKSGIHLIAGEKKKEKEAIGKLIGLKRARVILIADELPELSPAILEAAFSNLDANPFFQLIGIGNPNSIFDPHGTLSKPKDGWRSVSPNDQEWETEKGYHIRFDAYQSPNVLAGRVIYPWLPTMEKIKAKIKELGAESLAFWRMWRGFWCPGGSKENVVSEADIIKFGADEKNVKWAGAVTKLAFLDPGFTNGGDRSVLYFADYGLAHADDGTTKHTLLYTGYMLLHEDITKKDQPRNFQIVEQFKKNCQDRGVLPSNAGFDATGAGGPFGDIVATVWSPLVRRVMFGGKASALPVSAENKTPAHDKYSNRVSEIWYSIREFMRGGQIKGVEADFAQELIERQVKTEKGGGSKEDVRMRVESKKEMKGRISKSPDIADAGLGVLDVARSVHKFRAAASTSKAIRKGKGWKGFVKHMDITTRSGNELLAE